jgi:predicted dehydrogenase
MANRRDFIKGAAGAALFSKTVLGANDRINYAIIGLGSRTALLDAAFFKQSDGNLAAICDCNKAKIDAYQSGKLAGKKVESFIDYRRVIEKKDVDAVVIVTPDHLHAPMMIAALEAGKDVYVEKPCSNTVQAAAVMLKAYRSHKQIVQHGTQQRSWDHFQEASKLVRDGAIGNIRYVMVAMGTLGGGTTGGRRTSAPAPPAPVPEGLNWDLFLGPAKKVPFDPARLSWRGWWDYSGGGMSDMGTHWMDIVHLAMGTDTSGPSFCSAVSTGSEDPEKIPGTFVTEFKYPNFLMTQTSFAPPTAEPIVEGPTFYGTRGFLRLNRNGYCIRRYPANASPVRGGRGGMPAGGGAAQTPVPPIEEKSYFLTYEDNVAHERASEVIHVRNFFDCIKSRQKPVAEFEVGFHSTLPCLLCRQAVKDGRALIWDENSLTVRPA